MITAGMDIGTETIKVVILSDGKILGHSIVLAGSESQSAAKEAFDQAMARAGVKRQDIKRAFGTGVAGESNGLADDYISDVTCDARGAVWLAPAARTVIDIGAEESRVMKCDPGGRALSFAKNDKCASGVGSFVRVMARALEVPVEKMGELSLKSDQEIPVNTTCVVFAESEVISLIHAGRRKEDIARAIHDAIASRTVSLVGQVGAVKDVVFIGGVAKNSGVIDSLKRKIGSDLVIPDEPEIVSALGAALLAAAA